MADVAHSTLTGANLHEPKGIAAATVGQVYVADGAASGSMSIPFTVTADIKNLNLMLLTYKFEDVSTGSSQWVVAPIAGDVKTIYSVLHGAIITGNAGFTFEIAGTPITNGAVTITQAGSAAGDIDSATPTAAKTLTAGQSIELISDGVSGNDVDATFTFVIDVS